jgi:hypothetical protein
MDSVRIVSMHSRSRSSAGRGVVFFEIELNRSYA